MSLVSLLDNFLSPCDALDDGNGNDESTWISGTVSTNDSDTLASRSTGGGSALGH